MNASGRYPLLMVVSAPSGAGKTTLCRRLLEEFPDLRYSVSCTTRLPRGQERDGVEYHFLTRERFEAHVDAGDFLEHAQVHDAWYGTLRNHVESAQAQGCDVLLDIDVQGAGNLRRTLLASPRLKQFGTGYFDVFIDPPSKAELARRLRARGQDGEATVARRLQNAEVELERAGEYRYRVTNDRLETAYDILRAVLIAERHRVRSGGDGGRSATGSQLPT